jgi:signal recognition particle subunit SRP54
MGGGGRKARQQQVRGKKSKSGNPAKRAAEAQAEAQRAASRPAGTSFGGGPAGGLDPAAMDPSQLPKGFEKFLGK